MVPREKVKDTYMVLHESFYGMKSLGKIGTILVDKRLIDTKLSPPNCGFG